MLARESWRRSASTRNWPTYGVYTTPNLIEKKRRLTMTQAKVQRYFGDTIPA
jgi:hypothetical protein